MTAYITEGTQNSLVINNNDLLSGDLSGISVSIFRDLIDKT
jgi:hypothetical protein